MALLFTTVTLPTIMMIGQGLDQLEQADNSCPSRSRRSSHPYYPDHQNSSFPRHPIQQKLFPSLFFSLEEESTTTTTCSLPSTTIEKPRLQRQLTHLNWEYHQPQSQEDSSFTPPVVADTNNNNKMIHKKLRSHPTQSHLVKRFAASASRYWNVVFPLATMRQLLLQP